ncbi:MAG: DNA polymerase III subunit delta' [Eubacteriales bacterium]
MDCMLQIKKAVENNKLVHLLLFHGSGTVEREKAGLDLAKFLNCTYEGEKPCGNCLSCKKISTGNHPDVYILKPLKSSLGIEQILNWQETISRKNFEGSYKVTIINDAEKLTLPAANALLKVAEDPPANTLIILSTGNAEGIISTLRSRAQMVYFSLPNSNQWVQMNNVSDEQKEQYLDAYNLSGQDPDLARKILLIGTERIIELLSGYSEAISKKDFLKIFSLFPMEKEECLILLQVLAVQAAGSLNREKLQPSILSEIKYALEAVRRQANYRLALEVLSLKQIDDWGGILNGNGSRN